MPPVTVGYRSWQISHSPSSIDQVTPIKMQMHSQDFQWTLILTLMKLCTENVFQGDINACCVGVGAQGRGETIWVSAVSNDSSLLNMEEVSLGSSVDEISKISLLDAQKQDQVIGRLLTFLKTGKWPKSWEIKRELPATKVLLRQRREFENKLFHRLEKLSGVTRLRTTPYHPQGNGKVERFNRTLLHMSRTLPESQKHKWKDSLNKVVHAYNSSRNDATGFSPFYLLFGRSPRLPVDLMFGLSREDTRMNHTEYTEKWKVAMKDAYEMARQNISKSSEDGKKQYDRKVRFSSLQPGDRVLVRNLSERGRPGKLRSYWEQEVHLIVEQKGDLPVFEVTPEGRKGKSRMLHRNLLLPCDFLQTDLSKPVPQHTHERRSVPANQGRDVHQHGSDSGDEGELPGLSPTELEMLSSPTA